jgi:hypothetical protein
MTELTQEGNNNIRSSELPATGGTLIQTNSDPEGTEYQSIPSESFVPEDEIQMTLKEFNEKIKDNDISIKRLEKSLAVLYDKLDKTPLTQEPKVPTKKLKKKKGKKIDKKGKKGKKIDKKGKKGKKIDKKGKKGKGKKIKRSKKSKSAKASINTERTRLDGRIQKVRKGARRLEARSNLWNYVIRYVTT